MLSPPRTLFWNRKRWMISAVLWLVIAYPLGAGPVVYLNARQLLPDAALQWYLTPYVATDSLFQVYLEWWEELAAHDAGADAAS